MRNAAPHKGNPPPAPHRHRAGRRTGRGRAWLAGALIGLIPVLGPLAAAGAARAAVEVTDLRTWSAPERTRLVLDLSGESVYRVRRQAQAPHLVVEIEGAANRTGRTAWKAIDARVRGVAIEQAGSVTRVAVTLAGPAPYKHFALSPYGSRKPHRIVLDVYTPRRTRAPAPAPAPAARTARPFVVVVDAGHGGEDPGAVGRYYRTREKDVVLSIARRLKREIDAMPGMRAELTRKGDYFISLGGRIRKAEALGGDLFISIHADTSRDRRTRGTHVYSLAPRNAGARSRAMRVARKENASDFVGGVQAATRLPMIFDRDGSPNTMVESRVLARLALGRFRDINHSGREGRRSEARFWVLKGDRPSVLVETAFLSNRDDERHLRTAEFQDKVARDLALAVHDYYETRVRGGSVVHTVRPGETLSQIAARYGVGLSDLTASNRIASANRIRTGDKLLVPRAGWPGHGGSAPPVRRVSYSPAPAPVAAPPPPAPVTRRHTVRSGENLTRIAQRYGVRLTDLMRANGLNARSRLLVGQHLVVPTPRPDDRVHTVRPGQTLSGLAQAHHIPLWELARVNDLGVRGRLRVGQRLILPGVGPAPLPAARSGSRSGSGSPTHTVRRGETLSGLAARYRVSQSALARANGLGLWARLLVGQRLVVPTDGAPARPREHRVGRGETLSGLAARYRVPLGDLARANGLSTRARLLKGQHLVIPTDGAPAPPREHRVGRGETLSGLAARYRVPLGDLARANGLSTRTRLLKGQRLVIPGGGGGASGPRVHVIRRGESLSRIALRYDVSVEALQSTNALRDADRLMVGTRLVIPR
jgi:N-acetylmuramoyl-L-alanine amidase